VDAYNKAAENKQTFVLLQLYFTFIAVVRTALLIAIIADRGTEPRSQDNSLPGNSLHGLFAP